MIHRIDRVNPDVDDRVIKPNEARMAKNLRFGASTDDTNLSGGTLILGNKKLTAFIPPAGTNKVVGVYADLESRNVFFAAYNSNGNHGIYRINGGTDEIQAVAFGIWLNFQGADEYNVSITGVDGKLYWTDNVNEPRMVNVEKGIRTQAGETIDVYTPVVEPWHYTQIKRPPGQALEVSPQPEIIPEEVSLTKFNRAANAVGFQYSYYYVYDNNEESRLAPFSINTYGNLNVTLTIPQTEFTEYGSNRSLIKAIVIVARNGNDGVWKEIRYSPNDGTTRSFLFQNILAASKATVASDIVDARYDSVPLVSATNEIAQNKINHANYLIDYDAINDINFNCSIVRAFQAQNTLADIGININLNTLTKSYCPWGRYAIGVEFVDGYGRTLPVRNFVDKYAPFWSQGSTGGSTPLTYPAQAPGSSPTIFDDKAVDNGSQSIGIYEISGALPEWVARVNIVRSRAKNIIQVNQSAGFMYLWYKNAQGQDELIEFVNYGLNPEWIAASGTSSSLNQDMYNINPGKTFMGYVMKFNSGEAFVQGENQYIYIKNQYTINNRIVYYSNDIYADTYLFKFKVEKIVGSSIFFSRMTTPIIHPSYTQFTSQYSNNSPQLTPLTFPIAEFWPDTSFENANQITKYNQLLYNFVLTTEGEADDSIVYTTEKTITRAEYQQQIASNGKVVGIVEGDMSICLAVKTFPNQDNYVITYNPGIPPTQATSPKDPRTEFQNQILPANGYPAQGYYGWFLSMNPVDIYNSEWNQNIGQVNTTNYKATQNRLLPSNICFSGNIIQGTQVNGLNKFNSLDFRQAPAENGPITALVTTNATQREPGVLLAIGTFGVSSFYYDAIQLTNVDGSNNVTTTDAYLASQRPLIGQYGTARPMSVTKTPLGTVYWWSDVVNDMIRYSNAGLERLGNTFSFANYLRKNYNDTPLLITWYDQVTDEINLIGTGKPASVFSERFKTFQGERDYTAPFPTGGLTPDRGIGVATRQYLFVNGEVYVTDVDDSSIPNNFIFGEFKNPDLTIVTNESPVNVKRWNQIKMFGSRPTRVILSSSGFDLIDSNTLLSFIEPGWWIKRKGDWEVAIRRASNTEGGVYAGKLMESRIIYSNFAFSAEGFEKLNFIEVKSNVSIVQ
jgi:hypothetical protein